MYDRDYDMLRKVAKKTNQSYSVVLSALVKMTNQKMLTEQVLKMKIVPPPRGRGKQNLMLKRRERQAMEDQGLAPASAQGRKRNLAPVKPAFAGIMVSTLDKKPAAKRTAAKTRK